MRKDSSGTRRRLATKAARGLWVAVSLGLGGCTDKVLDASSSGGKAVGEACAPDDPRGDPRDEVGCGEGLACEPVLDSEAYVCAEPVEILGRVVDALDDGAIEGARVVAADALGAPVTAVVSTDAEGRYVLPVTVPREPSGEIAPGQTLRWTLLVSASGYLPFPGAMRPALPITLQQAGSVIDDASTTVALVPVPSGGSGAGGVTLSGKVEGEHAAGTLVVAEGLDPAPLAVADVGGAFTLFNVPAGATVVRGYRAGLELAPVAVQVQGQDITDLRLTVITDDVDAMAVVGGSVNLVDAGGGLATSVVLVPRAAFHEAFERGPVPLGLRAPAPPEAPSITSRFEIPGVPAGRFMVLAAFENDQLVRDPDASISGTQILEIEVAAGQAVDLAESFKITEALVLVGPGAEMPEEVGATPTFAWVDDASEDRYEIVVYDALGTEVWRDDQIPRVTGGGHVEVPYGGPALTSGMIYQFRATSWSDGPLGSTALSRTEDLRGVFVVR